MEMRSLTMAAIADLIYFTTLLVMVAVLLCIAQPCFSASTSKTISGKHHQNTSNSRHIAHKKKSVHASRTKLLAKKTRKTHHTRSRYPSTSANLQALLNSNRIIQSNLPAYLLNTNEQRLVSAIYQTVSTLRYSSYKLGGTHIDTERGIYVVDCSGYVDHILNTVFPRAYSSLVTWSGTEKPTSDDYYHYFSDLTAESGSYWNPVDDVEALRPGDVLVFRNTNTAGNERGGHVMIVMDKPKQESNAYMVRVSDTAPSGHSKDTRAPHTSGIGIGTLLLKVNPKTSQPYAYAWKLGAQWKNNVAFAMARPRNLTFS